MGEIRMILWIRPVVSRKPINGQNNGLANLGRFLCMCLQCFLDLAFNEMLTENKQKMDNEKRKRVNIGKKCPMNGSFA